MEGPGSGVGSVLLQAVAATRPVSSKTAGRKFFILTREVFMVDKDDEYSRYEGIKL